MDTSQPLVAIFNSDVEVIERLKTVLGVAGFRTVALHVADVQSGAMDLVAFIDEQRPDAVVYDLPRPYEANRNFVRLLRETDSLKSLPWVMTTIDKAAVERALGHNGVVLHLIGRPHSDDDIVEAVRRGLLEADGLQSRT